MAAAAAQQQGRGGEEETQEGALAAALAALALSEDGFCPKWEAVEEGWEAGEAAKEERSVAFLQGVAAGLGQG